MKALRVYEINTYSGIKSTGRIAFEIAQLVNTDGGECRIGYGVPQITKEATTISDRIGGKADRKLHGVLRKLFDAEGYGSIIATKRLIKRLEVFQPDLIHLHNIHGCYLNHRILFGYLQKSNVPVVWTLHDCWPFTGHCAYYDYAGCERWKSKCRHCPEQRSYPVCIGLDGSGRNHRHKKKLFGSLDLLTFAAPCSWMAEQVRSSYFGNANVRIIPNGVDQTIFHPTQSKIREQYAIGDRKLILSVASDWDRRKGLPYLIDASKQLGSAYCFAVIGLTQNQIDSLPKNMIGITSVKPQELAAWYSAADCLANPTLEDNMPMVNLESLSCGTPIVAFDTGGCAEAVGNCGCIVPKRDVDAFCKAIRHIADHKAEYIPQCLERSKQYDAKLTYAQYIELYKELTQ